MKRRLVGAADELYACSHMAAPRLLGAKAMDVDGSGVGDSAIHRQVSCADALHSRLQEHLSAVLPSFLQHGEISLKGLRLVLEQRMGVDLTGHKTAIRCFAERAVSGQAELAGYSAWPARDRGRQLFASERFHVTADVTKCWRGSWESLTPSGTAEVLCKQSIFVHTCYRKFLNVVELLDKGENHQHQQGRLVGYGSGRQCQHDGREGAHAGQPTRLSDGSACLFRGAAPAWRSEDLRDGVISHTTPDKRFWTPSHS